MSAGEAARRRGVAWHLIDLAMRASGLVLDLGGGTYRTRGMRFRIPKRITSRGWRGRFLLGLHEREERRLIARHLPERARVLELGGCLGVVACIVNRRLKRTEDHVVVEPDPRALPYLRTNRDANGCRFAIEAVLVGPASGMAPLGLRRNLGGSGVCREGIETVEVPVATIEELEARHEIAFDTLIMDVEGAERDILATAAPFLARVRLVIVELHPAIIGEALCEEARRALATGGLARIDALGDVEVWSRGAES